MCTECNLAFFLSPLKAGIVAFSFFIAIAALIMLRRLRTVDARKRLALLYVHVFAFVFPFLFFVFFRGCQVYLSGCDRAKAIVAMLGLTAVIAIIIAFAVAPVFFMRRHVRKAPLMENPYWNGFIKGHSPQVRKLPRLHVLNTAIPVAFSFSLLTPRIFMSAGLFDILGRKELEAVILHELAHIRGRSSFMKLSGHIARVFSPLSALASFGGEGHIDEEEKSADLYAASVQGTFRHVGSAKMKIMAYNSEKG